MSVCFREVMLELEEEKGGKEMKRKKRKKGGQDIRP